MRRFVWALALLVPTTASAQPGETPPSEPAPVVEPPPAVPVPVVTKPPAVASSDDLDLATLDLVPGKVDEHLNIYGFIDFGWRDLMVPDTSLAANYFPKESSFFVGNVNLYVAKNLSSHWRSMLEVRFLYAPAGATNTDGTFVHTSAPDPGDLQRPVSWGSIAIERVYLEYEVNESLTIQAGSFLTPYGIWNVDHGSPAIIPVSRPYIIGEQLFPQQQTGLHLYGKHPIGDYQLSYHGTLSNGRGPFQAFRDLDDNMAVGGRLELETPWLDGVHIGISGYRGRFTDRPADVITADASGNLTNSTPAGTQYDEVSYGADLLVRRGGLHIQAEVIGNDRHYLVNNRELVTGGFAADGRYLGSYALVGYRFDRWWQLMPFAIVELDRMRPTAAVGDKPVVFQPSIGLNFRPDPSVVLKLQYNRATIYSQLDLSFGAFSAQAAWAF